MKLQLGNLHIAVSEVSDGNMSDRFNVGSPEANRARFLMRYGCEVRDLCFMAPDQRNRIVWLDRRILTTPSDAFITMKKQVVLGVCAADCPSLILFEPKLKLLAHVHCGRSPLEKGIIGETGLALQCGPSGVNVIEKAIEELLGPKPLDGFVAFVTPGIGSCCYHFDEGYYEAHLQTNWPDAERTPDGKYAIDLFARIRADLQRLGITNVMTLGGCSVCQKKAFSHRLASLGKEAFLGRNLVVTWFE